MSKQYEKIKLAEDLLRVILPSVIERSPSDLPAEELARRSFEIALLAAEHVVSEKLDHYSPYRGGSDVA